MILFVATTGPPLRGGIRVWELDIDERDAEDADADGAVDPEWEDRGTWPIPPG
jgi:hypothetical protein